MSDDHYWLKMFHCALKEQDQCAQKMLKQKFSSILFKWIQANPKGTLACRLHTKEYYVNETFRSFWHTYCSHQNFDFSSMADVLSLLHASLNGVILDALRSCPPPQKVSCKSTATQAGELSKKNDHNQDLWPLIERTLSNQRERRIAYLLFQCALKPGEIVASFPREFHDLDEIAQIRRGIIQLLSR